MKYNFDKQIERRGTNSYKWDLPKEDDVIPMWVADMDFQTAPCIIEALKKRVEHGVFGYTLVPDSYFEAITNWFKRRHNWQIDRSWILYTSGVVPALTASLQALTMPGEKVLIQTPAYNCFFTSIMNCGCQVEETALKREGNSFVMDFEDFERKCADPKVTVFVLCNPHNPSGRVWSKEELLHINDICTRNGVKIISDEIHCELIMPEYTFTAFASISDECRDNSITLNSPSKSFNIAGLQIANIICSDKTIRQRIDRALNINEVCDVNPFGVIALQEAYNNGEEWLDELNEYLYGNYKALKEFFSEYLPKLEVIRLEGTYLVWIDISRIELTADEA
ncbi:MAG: pyridoxal phosphate-dependent aminotransferase, partial [Prevotella sp.]|nr:pyridoxal phosphate-dependent aminotransferase [Prevotella sp.]